MSLKHTKIISVISTKGGSGKTTLTAIAGYLTSLNKKVLIIAIDPQPSLSSYYKINDFIKDVNGNLMGLSNKLCLTRLFLNLRMVVASNLLSLRLVVVFL